MRRRLGGASAARSGHEAVIAWRGAVELARDVRAGELDANAVVHEHLERIARFEPRVHAYVYVDMAARAKRRGILAGVTVAVKDTQAVRGMPWTLGTAKWRDRIADEDAIPVALVRAAGAAILGKTNTPELAAAVGTSNELFPPTENPWRAGVTPGGSSGGSAAAVATGLSTVALGDDYGGSIRIPSACCGVVGLRPSAYRVGQENLDAGGLNSRGPIARSVADLRLTLEVMSGAPAPSSLGQAMPRRVGVVRASSMGADAACWEACQRAADALAALGYELEDVRWDPDPVARGYRVVRRFSLAGNPGDPREYGACVRQLVVEGRQIGATHFYEAHYQATQASQASLRLLLRGELRAILTPTLGMLPMPIPEVPNFLYKDWDRYTQFVLPVSFAGLPAISIPAGSADGLPVGVQLVGQRAQEWLLLDLAEELETASGFGFVKPPNFAD